MAWLELYPKQPPTSDGDDDRPIRTRRVFRPALGGADRIFLAALLAGAGAIHFAMVPTHAQEWYAEGVAFAIVAWVQLLLAGLIAVRPSRPVLAGGILVNLGAIAAWLISRTAGFPFGPSEGTSEAFGSIDVLTAVLEGLFVIVATVALVRPAASGERRRQPMWLAAAVVPLLLVAGLTTALLASPEGQHHHDEGETAAGGHHHGGGLVQSADPLEIKTLTLPAGMALGHSHSHSTEAQAGGSGGHGHGGPVPHKVITDRAVRDQLADELETARSAAEQFPTAADAMRAGYFRVTPYVPLIGAHYMNFGYVDGEFDPTHPEMLLYDANGPDAHMVGLSYYVVSEDGPPEGFAGPDDYWHEHLGLCVNATGVIGGEDTTEEECEELGGFKTDGDGKYMVHAWVVPGWESPWGVFSDEHPDLVENLSPDGAGLEADQAKS